MKKHNVLTAGLLVSLASISFAEDKKVGEVKTAPKSVAYVLGESSIAVDARLAVVESYAVMGDANPGVQEREEMEIKQNNARAEIQEEAKKLEKAKNDYAKKAPAMTESARKSEEMKLAKMERDLNDLAQEKGEELKQEMQVATERLMQELEVAVAELATEEKLDVVVDKMSGRILYVSEKFDFTEKTIDKINKRHEVKLAQNKKAEKTVVAENKTAAAKPAAKKTT
jgi:Skp family chaperone for outer membrane proteins